MKHLFYFDRQVFSIETEQQQIRKAISNYRNAIEMQIFFIGILSNRTKCNLLRFVFSLCVLHNNKWFITLLLLRKWKEHWNVIEIYDFFFDSGAILFPANEIRNEMTERQENAIIIFPRLHTNWTSLFSSNKLQKSSFGVFLCVRWLFS